MKRFLITASVAALMATGAHAAVVDLTTGGDVTSLGTLGSFDDGMLTGSIDPWRAGGFTDFLTQTSSGLGVTGAFDTSGALDGFVDESITFSFGFAVNLISVTFARFGRHDDADIYVNGSLVADDSSANPYLFGASGLGASSFKIGADGFLDNFRVKSFEYEKIAAVPLPAGGLLLIGALGGLGALRRRKKAA